MEIVETKFSDGKYFRPVTLTYVGKSINVNFPYNATLKDEVKAMEGARFDWDTKTWKIDNSARNKWGIAFLEGKKPYARYEQKYVDIPPKRALYGHQVEAFQWGLTVRRGIMAYEMGLGKTLVSIEIMEQVGGDWWWVGPKRPLEAVHIEMKKWGCKNRPDMMTYEQFVKKMQEWPEGKKGPIGIVFDEAQKLKTPGTKRTKTALHTSQYLDYVFLLTGTPAPKSPLDWWSLCEIAQPGFLRESNIHKFQRRLALMETVSMEGGSSFPRLVTWYDNENKCKICGQFQDGFKHDENTALTLGGDYHRYQKSVDEIQKLYRRMKGLVVIKFKKDCLELPPKQYRKVYCKLDKKFKHYVSLFQSKATSALEKLTWMRELSDGFIYNEKKETKHIGSPKEEALKELLDEFEDLKRIVVFAGFTASVDLCAEICSKAGWTTIKLDGRGMVSKYQNPLISFLDETIEEKIAFVAQPDSGGVGLNLQSAEVMIFYSNSFKGESRMQAEDRIHRPGMKGSATIIDIFCLPTDEYVYDNIQKKKDLQAVTMGEINNAMSVDLGG